MAFDPAKNPTRNRYFRGIEDNDPPTVIILVLKLHVESEEPISNQDVRRFLVDVVRVSVGDKLHTDQTNACEQAGLLERVSDFPTVRRVTDKGRLFYERHRYRLDQIRL